MNSDIKKKISNTIPWVFVATFALLPFSAKLANVTALLVLVLWLVEGGLKEKWAAIRSNPVAFIPILYFLILCVGLLWTSDLDWGLHIIKKARRFLLIPVFLSVASRNPWVFRRGLYAFLGSVFCVVVISLGIASGLIPQFDHATRSDPSLFTSHIAYTPMLAWAAYLCLVTTLFGSKLSKHWKIVLWVMAIFMGFDLFLTRGVAGYAAAFMLFGLLILQWRKSILWPALAIILLAGGSYVFSLAVHERVTQNVEEFERYRGGSTKTEADRRDESIGPRLVFWENTWQLIKKYPVLGVGTGDFPAEYEKVRQEHTPKHHRTDVNQPHNMYLQVWAQTGLLGLIVFLGLFAALFRQTFRRSVWKAKMARGLLAFILLIMMSDAYMQISHTSLLFVLFAAILAADEEHPFNSKG